MSFEDRLKEQFRRADASMPGERIDWSTTITTARRSRMRFAAFVTVAAVSVFGIGAYALVTVNEDPSTGPIGPATSSGSDTEPQPEETASAVERPCYATEITVAYEDLTENNDDLPVAVGETRGQILFHASECEFDALEQLALAGGPNFQYSYGVEEGAAMFWGDREREAHRKSDKNLSYMRGLARVLYMPYCTETQDDGTGTGTEVVYYIWPRVHCADHRTDEDWNDLQGLYTDEQIDQMRGSDLYYGFRVGILEDGDWVYFVAGD